MNISAARLNVAAWLSITTAVLTIPILMLSVAIETGVELGRFPAFAARATNGLLTVCSAALFVYVFSTLRVLLEERYSFHSTSGLLRFLIGMNVLLGGLSVIGILSPAIDNVADWLSMIAIIPFGICFIGLGIKLLRLPQNLHGMLKPFSYTAIASGFCFATILFIPIAVLVGAANDIILAIIFFRESEAEAA